MILLKNINKKYNDKIIFKNLNLELPDSGLVIISGESGIGKTTLLNILSKKDNDYEGEVYYSEKFTVSYMNQEYNLLEELNVNDNVNLFKNNTQKIFELNNILKKKISTISGGENKRVSINQTFNKNANIYILDEPTESLDQTNINIFKKFIKEKSKNSLIIISSHKRELDDLANIVINICENNVDKIIINKNDDISFEEKHNKISLLTFTKLILNRFIINIKYNLINILLLILVLLLLIITILATNLDLDKIEVRETINNNYNRIVLIGNLNEKNNYNNVYNYYNKDKEIKLNINYNSKESTIFYDNYSSNFITSSNNINEEIVGRNIVNDNEIIITEYLYEVIKKYGLKLSEESLFKPKTMDELLNKTTYLGNSEVRIVGIVKQNTNRYKILKETKELKGLKINNLYYQFMDEIIENNIIYISENNKMVYTNKELVKQYAYIQTENDFLKLIEDNKYKNIEIISPLTTTLNLLEGIITLIKKCGIVSLIITIIILVIQFVKLVKDILKKNENSNNKLKLNVINNTIILNIIEIIIPIILSVIISVIASRFIINILNEILKIYFYIEFNIF